MGRILPAVSKIKNNKSGISLIVNRCSVSRGRSRGTERGTYVARSPASTLTKTTLLSASAKRLRTMGSAMRDDQEGISHLVFFLLCYLVIQRLRSFGGVSYSGHSLGTMTFQSPRYGGRKSRRRSSCRRWWRRCAECRQGTCQRWC